MPDVRNTVDRPPAALGAKLVLVTGASGFVGSALTAKLAQSLDVRAAYRSASASSDARAVGNLGPDTNWRAALEGVDAVVHLAGPAHARHAPRYLHDAIVGGTTALVDQAAAAGVSRFVFVSSIHACARRTHGAALTEAAAPHPSDAYGVAKLAAERVVLARSELNPVVMRPPLVIGAKAKGNFAHLLRLLDTELPLPFAGIPNKRSLISLDSLCAALTATLQTPFSTQGVFHVCDEPAVSIADMATLLRDGMGRTARLFSAPGIGAVAPSALVHDLEVDASRFREAFGVAGADMREALRACGQAWRARS